MQNRKERNGFMALCRTEGWCGEGNRYGFMQNRKEPKKKKKKGEKDDYSDFGGMAVLWFWREREEKVKIIK